MAGAELGVDAPRGFLDLSPRLAVLAQAFPARFGDLNEREVPAQVGTACEQTLDREELLVDPFGVVESIDTDAEPDVGGQLVLATDLRAALRRGRRRTNRGVVPLDADRVDAHARRVI